MYTSEDVTLILIDVRTSARGYDVPGIILSGDLPSVLRSVKAPVARCVFLSKPVDTAALIDSIEQLSATLKQQCGSADQAARTQSR